MAHAPNNIVKPYTEVQKSPDIRTRKSMKTWSASFMLGFILPNKVLFVFMGGAGLEGVCPSCVLCCMPCLLYDHASTPSRIINHAMNTTEPQFSESLWPKSIKIWIKRSDRHFDKMAASSHRLIFNDVTSSYFARFFYFQTHPARFFIFKRTILYGPLVFVLKRTSFAFF